MASKVKPGTPHPSKGGLVMGTKGRYVAKSTYAKQKKAATAKPAASKPAKASPQKALPPAGKSSGSQRRFQAKDKATKAARGTKGTQTRAGGTSNLARSSALAKVSKVAKVGRVLGPAGLAVGGAATAKNLADSLKRGEGFASIPKVARAIAKDNSKANKGSTGRSGAKRRQANQPKAASTPAKVTSRQKTNRRGRVVGSKKPSVKPARRGMSNIPPGEGTGKGSPNDKKPASTTKASTTKSSTRSSKPKVKKKSSVSGVGPVKSGRRYSVDVSGKSVSRQNVDQLRKMGPNSERSKKLREEAKKKSLAQGKKNRERNKRRRFGRG